MSSRYRWSDDFSTDPFADPSYSIDPGGNAWTYNPTTDLLENTAGASSMSATATLLNSDQQSGIIEAELSTAFFNNTSFISLHAFGYWFMLGNLGGNTPRMFILPDDHSPGEVIAANNYLFTTAFKDHAHFGFKTWKIVATPISVDWYIDGSIQLSAPPKASSGNIAVNILKAGATSGGSFTFSRLNVKQDSSLPSEPVVLTPGLSGGLSSTTGPIVVQTPVSRLYLDLGAFAGRIRDTGLTNVFYDPSGANVAMSEDTGVSDGVGGTTGDYYLEAPVRGVSSDHRLVFKEAFVIANTVVVTDDVDFDIVDGPTGQNALVKQEDDVHCYLDKHTTANRSEDVVKAILNPNVNISLHNINADGNDAYVANNPPRAHIFAAGGTIINGQSALTFNNASIVLPFIFDLDLGRVRDIAKFQYARLGEFVAGARNAVSFDIYSKPTPFVGSSLAQGTLEVNDYSPSFIGLISGPTATDTDYFFPSAEFVQAADISIKTRYLRLVFNADNFSAVVSNNYIFHHQLMIFEQETLGSINSFDDNAQFEYDSGSGFVAFPVGGVTQDVGQVRITLPSTLEHDGNSPNYYKIYFKPDITD